MVIGIVVPHHDPECFMASLDCCPQGQGHSEGLKSSGNIYRTSHTAGGYQGGQVLLGVF